MWPWLLSIVGMLHYYNFAPSFHLWFCEYLFLSLRFILCRVTLPGIHAGHSALTWGKPVFFAHLGFPRSIVVRFFPRWGFLRGWFFCVRFSLFSPHSVWCALLFWGRGFPLFLGFSGFFIFSLNRVYKRTVVLDGSGFPENVKVEDIASKIVDCFGSDNVLFR